VSIVAMVMIVIMPVVVRMTMCRLCRVHVNYFSISKIANPNLAQRASIYVKRCFIWQRLSLD
ncbi:MAG: hypothetical protein ACXWJB_03840, partial [Limisphaerales bacterium]